MVLLGGEGGGAGGDDCCCLGSTADWKLEWVSTQLAVAAPEVRSYLFWALCCRKLQM